MFIEAPTGEAFEQEFFGFSRQDVIKKKVPRKTEPDFLSRVAEIRKIQHVFDWNPRSPRTKLAKALHDRVRSQMGSEKNLVLICWSIGTKLDSEHGTDLFFVCGKRIVTVDLTISPDGKKNPKADIVLTLAHFQKNLHYKVADKIARLLQEVAQYQYLPPSCTQ